MNKEEFNNYNLEANEKWGNTEQYQEFKQRNKSNEELEIAKNQLMSFFSELGELKQENIEGEVVQNKIKALQEFITNNYYNCTNEVLKGLGQMYVNDQRFKRSIDKAGGEGTAEFVRDAILVYCSNFS